MCVPFSAFELPRRDTRRILRRFKKMGLAEFYRGLMSEEMDQVAGSGYCITKEGEKLAKQLEL